MDAKGIIHESDNQDDARDEFETTCDWLGDLRLLRQIAILT